MTITDLMMQKREKHETRVIEINGIKFGCSKDGQDHVLVTESKEVRAEAPDMGASSELSFFSLIRKTKMTDTNMRNRILEEVTWN